MDEVTFYAAIVCIIIVAICFASIVFSLAGMF